jgi:hypothetical protein
MKNSEIGDNIFSQPRQRLSALSAVKQGLHFVFENYSSTAVRVFNR